MAVQHWTPHYFAACRASGQARRNHLAAEGQINKHLGRRPTVTSSSTLALNWCEIRLLDTPGGEHHAQ
jgi:hypothetical protein